MTMALQPRWSIPTEYRGYRFRSRTEARWAVFFDTLQIKWHYELDGFDFTGLTIDSTGVQMPDRSRYLPDFWLPSVHCRSRIDPGVWVEVKGTEPTTREFQLAAALSLVTDHAVFIAIGPPEDPEDSHSDGLIEVCGDGVDQPMWFCRCDCGHVKAEFSEGNYYRCPCGRACDPYNDRIADAVKASRAARFETRMH